MRIAVYQMAIVNSDPNKNFEKIAAFMQTASRAGADLAVFPECCLTGVLDLGTRPDLTDQDGTYLNRFKSLCRDVAIDIVSGSFRESRDNVIYNVSYYIDYRGEVLARYCKRHLWHTERERCTPGEEIAVADTRFGRIGLAICWDLIFTEHFQQLSLADCDIIICPSYWSFEDAGRGQEFNKTCEVDLVNAACLSRAFETESALVYCNAAQPHPDGSATGLIGCSQVCLPLIGRLAVLNDSCEDYLIADLDMSAVDTAREVYKIRSDLKQRSQKHI